MIANGRPGLPSATFVTQPCGQDDLNYAQPFERHHLQKHKWFSFGFNGQLANYAELRDKLLADDDHHLSRTTDTEIIMHEISREMSGDRRPPLVEVMAREEWPAGSTGGLLPCAAQCVGRDGPRAGPMGIPTTLLRDRRTADGRGEQKASRY